LSVLKQMNPGLKIESKLQVQLLEKEKIIEIGKSLNSRSHKFKLVLNNLRLPLRYAVMSLLSMNRVSIFNENFIPFITTLAVDQRWNSEKYAEYGSYIIDQMSLELNPKKLDCDLMKAFTAQLEKPENKEHY